MSHYYKIGMQYVLNERYQATKVRILMMDNDVPDLLRICYLLDLLQCQVPEEGMPRARIKQNCLLLVHKQIGIVGKSRFIVSKAYPPYILRHLDRIRIIQLFHIRKLL